MLNGVLEVLLRKRGVPEGALRLLGRRVDSVHDDVSESAERHKVH